MKKYFGVALLCLAFVVPAAAQSGQSSTPPAQAPAPPPPFSTWLKNYYTGNRNNLAKAAEKMPEEDYGTRPGADEKVRTFGQLIGHIANANYFFCSAAKGEKDPHTTDYEKDVKTKADLVKGLNDSLAYCDAVYAAQTDGSLMETVTMTVAGRDGNTRQVQFMRVTRLIQNVAHNNEEYGYAAVYLRMKNILPPSSEPAPGR
jgi:uncharacterized damage-inducible protein DinB